jgi:hypothetical protein
MHWAFKSTKISKSERDIITQNNAKILESLADFESTARLVQLLEKIPNFKIKLTEEERRVIGQAGNVLALGRSGTGKTTCAVLRLFAQDLLFKIRVTKENLKGGILKDKRYFNDTAEIAGIHSVFVTASPVLTNEVNRFYNKLNEKVNAEIKRREELRKKTQESKEEAQTTEIVTKKPTEEEKQPEEEPESDDDEIDEEEYLMDEEEAAALAMLNKKIDLNEVEV